MSKIKQILASLISALLIITGININTDNTSYAASKDPNYEYMTFLIMGRFTAYPSGNSTSLQATWNSGSGSRTNSVSLGQKVNVHVGSGDGASPNLIPASEVSKWQIDYVGEYNNAPYGFEWGVDNNYHHYEDWLTEHDNFERGYLNFAPSNLNFKNYSLDSRGNIVFDVDFNLEARTGAKNNYDYYSKIRMDFSDYPSTIWDYWGGKSELQGNDPVFAKEIDKALNLAKTNPNLHGYIFPYPFVVVLKRPIAAEGITYEGYFLENGTQLRPYEDTKHTLDTPITFTADNIPGYELVGSKQQYETAPIGVSRNGVDNYTITWKKQGSSFNFRKNYIHYYYKPVDQDTGENPPPQYSYTSKPEAYGEVKQGTYSDSRSTEKWNAMAGFPHTESLFTDVGASFASIDMKTDTHYAETDNSSPSEHDVAGRGTHQNVSCSDGCGGSYCIRAGCPNNGASCTPCTGHTVQDGVDADGNPTYTTEYRDHRHGRCKTTTEEWTESFPVVEDFTVKAHQIGSYDIKTPMRAIANIPYTQGSPFVMTSNEQVTASEQEATWDSTISGLTKSMGTYACNEENKFSLEATNKIKSEYVANKSYFSYSPPSYEIDGLGQSLEFLVQTKAKFVQKTTTWNGTLSYKPEVLTSRQHKPTPKTCTICKGQYCSSCPEGPNHSHDYGFVTENYCTGTHSENFICRMCGYRVRYSFDCNQVCLEQGSCDNHIMRVRCDDCWYTWKSYEYRCNVPCGTRQVQKGTACNIDYSSYTHGALDNNYKYWEIVQNSGMNKYQTNFRPKAANWTGGEMDITGYNGEYSSYSRRTADRELFYKSGLRLNDYDISNGVKYTGEYRVEFVRTDSRGADVNAWDNAEPTYSPNHDKVNDVIVHSPISVSKLEVIPKTALSDQRIESQRTDTQRITPDSEFSVIFHTTWTGSVMNNSSAISELTGKTGKGYIYGLQTAPWIKQKAISFPFEIISKWDNIRHKKNEIIYLDKDKSSYDFYLPVSEKEASAANIKGYLEASNNLNQEINYKQWGSLNEPRYKNVIEDYDYAADHFVEKIEDVDVVGRIGNFEISYCDSDDFDTYFVKPDPNKPRIRDIWYDPLIPYEYNKYAATPLDMFSRSGLPYGFDRYNAIPRISKKADNVLPFQGDMMKQRMFNRLVPQLGNHLYFSLQSIGNYSAYDSRLAIVPKYKILNKKTGKITDVGEIWVANGLNYHKAYPRVAGATSGESGYVNEEAMKVSGIKLRLQDSKRFLSNIEKGRTKIVEPELFKNDEYVKSGNMGRITLDRNLRTFVGGFVSEGYNANPGYADGSIREAVIFKNGVSTGTDKEHSKGSQRWHGSLWLPSSSVFIEKGKTFRMSGDEIDTTDSVLLVSLYVQTLGGETFNLSTNLKEFNGEPELRIYKKGDNTYIRTVKLEKDVVAVFDVDERSNDKVTVRGIL